MEKIVFLSAQNMTASTAFTVSLAGITYPDPNYKIYRECSEVYVAEYVSDGEGTVICGGNEYHIKKGDAYILPAGKEQKYYSDMNNPWTKKWFNVSGILCEKVLAAYGIENTVCFHNTSIGGLFDEFFDYCAENTDVNSINQFGAIIFHRIVQSLATNTQDSTQNAATKIKSYIDRNVYEKLNAASVARNSGFSVSQLGRIFKSEYGETVYSYILEQKISTAENLLKNSGLSVKEISDMLKFADEHYFCNIFKKKRGVTPSRYRR
ncbi:MAG: AraC family transcriptional regulator [Acutalibacteraceae bacterium]